MKQILVLLMAVSLSQSSFWQSNSRLGRRPPRGYNPKSSYEPAASHHRPIIYPLFSRLKSPFMIKSSSSQNQRKIPHHQMQTHHQTHHHHHHPQQHQLAALPQKHSHHQLRPAPSILHASFVPPGNKLNNVRNTPYRFAGHHGTFVQDELNNVVMTNPPNSYESSQSAPSPDYSSPTYKGWKPIKRPNFYNDNSPASSNWNSPASSTTAFSKSPPIPQEKGKSVEFPFSSQSTEGNLKFSNNDNNIEYIPSQQNYFYVPPVPAESEEVQTIVKRPRRPFPKFRPSNLTLTTQGPAKLTTGSEISISSSSSTGSEEPAPKFKISRPKLRNPSAGSNLNSNNEPERPHGVERDIGQIQITAPQDSSSQQVQQQQQPQMSVKERLQQKRKKVRQNQQKEKTEETESLGVGVTKPHSLGDTYNSPHPAHNPGPPYPPSYLEYENTTKAVQTFQGPRGSFEDYSQAYRGQGGKFENQDFNNNNAHKHVHHPQQHQQHQQQQNHRRPQQQQNPQHEHQGGSRVVFPPHKPEGHLNKHVNHDITNSISPIPDGFPSQEEFYFPPGFGPKDFSNLQSETPMSFMTMPHDSKPQFVHHGPYYGNHQPFNHNNNNNNYNNNNYNNNNYNNNNNHRPYSPNNGKESHQRPHVSFHGNHNPPHRPPVKQQRYPNSNNQIPPEIINYGGPLEETTLRAPYSHRDVGQHLEQKYPIHVISTSPQQNNQVQIPRPDKRDPIVIMNIGPNVRGSPPYVSTVGFQHTTPSIGLHSSPPLPPMNIHHHHHGNHNSPHGHHHSHPSPQQHFYPSISQEVYNLPHRPPVRAQYIPVTTSARPFVSKPQTTTIRNVQSSSSASSTSSFPPRQHHHHQDVTEGPQYSRPIQQNLNSLHYPPQNEGALYFVSSNSGEFEKIPLEFMDQIRPILEESGTDNRHSYQSPQIHPPENYFDNFFNTPFPTRHLSTTAKDVSTPLLSSTTENVIVGMKPPLPPIDYVDDKQIKEYYKKEAQIYKILKDETPRPIVFSQKITKFSRPVSNGSKNQIQYVTTGSGTETPKVIFSVAPLQEVEQEFSSQPTAPPSNYGITGYASTERTTEPSTAKWSKMKINTATSTSVAFSSENEDDDELSPLPSFEEAKKLSPVIEKDNFSVSIEKANIDGAGGNNEETDASDSNTPKSVSLMREENSSKEVELKHNLRRRPAYRRRRPANQRESNGASSKLFSSRVKTELEEELSGSTRRPNGNDISSTEKTERVKRRRVVTRRRKPEEGKYGESQWFRVQDTPPTLTPLVPSAEANN